MKEIKNKEEIKGFMLKYPNLSITTATTIREGFVSCIGPVKTICGPELMCNPKTKELLVSFLRSL